MSADSLPPRSLPEFYYSFNPLNTPRRCCLLKVFYNPKRVIRRTKNIKLEDEIEKIKKNKKKTKEKKKVQSQEQMGQN